MFGVTSSGGGTGILATLGINHYVVSAWGVMLVLAIISYLTTRNLKKIPAGLQNVVEAVIEWLYNMIEDMMGAEKTKRYFPFLCTFFLFILMSNYIGLLPLSGESEYMYIPATASLSTTAALAGIAFLATHITGFMTNGLGYIKHFVKPMPFMLPLNIIEEVVRPVSLAFRLYGNIYGHELVIATLMVLLPYFAPVLMQMLGALTGLIQAGVFTLLTATYISGATSEGH